MVRLKVQAFKDGKQNYWKFQFLMVRLKEIVVFYRYISHNRISIPYGAIKRTIIIALYFSP